MLRIGTQMVQPLILPLEKGEGALRSGADGVSAIDQAPPRRCAATLPVPGRDSPLILVSIRIAVLALALLAPIASFAVTPDEMLRDPKLETRARDLSAQLRCMVCQNESIDESEASLARDIRHIVREKIAAGESDDAIIAFLVKRYGDFILLKPPLKIETLLLWGAPVLILLAGGMGIFFASRRRKAAVVLSSLTAAEATKLAALVGEEES